jgi:hypothetical protein
MHGCLAEKGMDERLKHAVSGAAYADDVGILTNTLSDLHVQAHKLSSYSDWGAMQVNVGKTIVSGVLHRQTHAARGITQKSAYNQVARQLTSRIKVQGQPVTYQDPREPFTYLGVVLTMTLDWRPQQRAIAEFTVYSLQFTVRTLGAWD